MHFIIVILHSGQTSLSYEPNIILCCLYWRPQYTIIVYDNDTMIMYVLYYRPKNFLIDFKSSIGILDRTLEKLKQFLITKHSSSFATIIMIDWCFHFFHWYENSKSLLAMDKWQKKKRTDININLGTEPSIVEHFPSLTQKGIEKCLLQ